MWPLCKERSGLQTAECDIGLLRIDVRPGYTNCILSCRKASFYVFALGVAPIRILILTWLREGKCNIESVEYSLDQRLVWPVIYHLPLVLLVLLIHRRLSCVVGYMPAGRRRCQFLMATETGGLIQQFCIS